MREYHWIATVQVPAGIGTALVTEQGVVSARPADTRARLYEEER
ncbi:hypothetical protein [Nocardiopsis composta]|uniref:Uncharacterized protein n=1 Tax=Nocardiopsis composta TaxID=157465 RepID=A0A7W8VH67_9ACTN|nr:hypothetical protein [Nocardiopsis composta]MBB5436301.1 hypothetical protein [Nocardiopsis composta]